MRSPEEMRRLAAEFQEMTEVYLYAASDECEDGRKVEHLCASGRANTLAKFLLKQADYVDSLYPALKVAA